MHKTHIVSIGKASPPYKFSQAEVVNFMIKAHDFDDTEARKLRILYRASAIDYRYSVLPDYSIGAGKALFPEDVSKGAMPGTSARMGLYSQHAPVLAVEAATSCLAERHTSPSAITHLITVSCTGMYAPGLDIDLMDRLELNTQVQRFSINFMGCYAAFNALKLADAICKADASAQVLVVCVELCTLHFQRSTLNDYLMANSIFADGAAALLLKSQQEGSPGISLEGFHSDLARQGHKDMAWHIGDLGFEMRLSAYVPEIIRQQADGLVKQLLRRFHIDIPSVEYFAVHPGGKKILEAVEKSLQISSAQNRFAYDVLRNFGNMSSVTVLFVLHQIWQQARQASHQGASILSMSFGPGLTIESALMRLYHD